MGDSTIVHELLHLHAPNHGKLWKSLMRAHLGDYKAVAATGPTTIRSVNVAEMHVGEVERRRGYERLGPRRGSSR